MVIVNDYELSSRRLHHSKSIRGFWNECREKYPELFEVAMVYLSIPLTQSTVERTFSTLAFVYNKRRSQLAQQTLENIILLKLNKEITFDVFADELGKL